MAMQRDELGKLAALIGGALVISGFVLQQVTNLSKWSTPMMVGGAILLVLGLFLTAQNILAFFSGRSGKLGGNLAVLLLAVLGIFAVVNYLGFKKHKRFDLTSEQLYSLSDQSRKVVAGLQKDVKVVHFNKQDNSALHDLITEYKGAGSRISYQFVDPEKNPEIAKSYKVTAFGDTIVVAGERIEKLEVGKTSEQDVTNAILKLTSDKLKTICFAEGHSERGIADQGPEGYAQISAKLKDENYEAKSIVLAKETQVPAECSVLILAGPKEALLPAEVSSIGKFLDGGGKTLLMVDPDTDPQANDLLVKWNIELGQNTVVDPSLQNQLSGLGAASAMVTNFGQHPITEKMARSLTVFPFAREIKLGKETGTGVNAQSLLSTSNESWGEKVIAPGGQVKFDEGVDTKGPLTIGVAGSKGMGENKEARFVVLGDSDFASNRGLRYGRNTDLFLNSINWLAQDESLISIRPKATTNRTVTMTEAQQKLLFLLLVVLMPLVVMSTGIYVWWKRR